MTPSHELLTAFETARLHAEAEAERERRRDFFRTALECLAWCALGLLAMAWGFHTTDGLVGPAMLYGGAGVGNAGVIFAVLGWYRRAERRGDR